MSFIRHAIIFSSLFFSRFVLFDFRVFQRQLPETVCSCILGDFEMGGFPRGANIVLALNLFEASYSTL